MKLPTVEKSGTIAVGMSEHLEAKEQAMFIAGFQECIKYLELLSKRDLVCECGTEEHAYFNAKTEMETCGRCKRVY
jgi:hypothetical protein